MGGKYLGTGHFISQPTFPSPSVVSVPHTLAVQAERSAGCLLYCTTALAPAMGYTPPLPVTGGPPSVFCVPETAGTAGSVCACLCSLCCSRFKYVKCLIERI